ncbi:hypothetical protein MHYP_G00104590 [Metynnis hypsauchen]
MIRISETQKDRFSISDDIRSKVLTVRISDVREDDGGVYYCGVGRGGGESVSYHSLYIEFQLQVTGKTYRTTSTALPSITSEETNAAPGSSDIIIIITVSVGVGLMLIGGSTLIFYKLRGKIRRDQALLMTIRAIIRPEPKLQTIRIWNKSGGTPTQTQSNRNP